jgi:hypothetical protein
MGCPVKAMAQEERTCEEKRQEYTSRPPLQNGPDVPPHPSHPVQFVAFRLAILYTPQGYIESMYHQRTVVKLSSRTVLVAYEYRHRVPACRDTSYRAISSQSSTITSGSEASYWMAS